MEAVDKSLLYLEVPLFSNSSYDVKCKEIIVIESSLDEDEDYSFNSCGGGLRFLIEEDERSLFWRTYDNVLELQERSINASISPSCLRIIMKNSKVIPNVEICVYEKSLIVLFATIHAVHKLTFSLSEKLMDHSIFNSLRARHLTDKQNNYYYNGIEQVKKMKAVVLTNSLSSLTYLFALISTRGEIVVIRMTEDEPTTTTKLESQSKVVRLLRGINPWASDGENTGVCSLTFAQTDTDEPKLLAVCRDHRVCMWSCKNQKNFTFTQQFQMNQFIEDEKNVSDHEIQTTQDVSTSHDRVCVLLKVDDASVFVLFELNSKSELKHLATIQWYGGEEPIAPQLVDFKLGADERLWVLSKDSLENVSLSVCRLNQQDWHEVALNDNRLDSIELTSKNNATVEEMFISELFVSGKFSFQAISKAFAIYTRSSITSTTWGNLQQDVLQYLHKEIEDFGDIEDLEVTQLSIYEKFLQKALQYRHLLSRPLGLSIPYQDEVEIIKIDHVSYLVPVSDLDAVCLGADPEIIQSLSSNSDDLDDFNYLLQSLSNLSSLLGEDFLDDLARSLQCTSSPIECVKDHLDDIQRLTDLNDEFKDNLSKISDADSAVEMLAVCLEDLGCQNDTEDVLPCSHQLNDNGIEILMRSLERFIKDRLRLSLLLLIFTRLVDIQRKVQSDVEVKVHIYNALWWIAKSKSEQISKQIESSLQNLSIREQGEESLMTNGSLMYEFLKSNAAICLSTFTNFNGLLTKQMVPEATKAVVKTLWPCGPTYMFPQFLLHHSQFENLERYMGTLLLPWCKFQPSYAKYLLARCHLHKGEHDEAAYEMIKAAESIHEDEHFLHHVIKTDPNQSSRFQIQMEYFSKVIDVFEKRQLHNQVIELAKCAISYSPNHNQSLSLRYSTIFQQCLELADYKQAFWAINCNPNYDLRKTCLRSLIVKLYERKEFKQLINFTYGELENDFIMIMEERARSSEMSDLQYPTQYDLLYSFHIFNKNYRRAASMMYEQYERYLSNTSLNQSLPVQSIHRQQQCLVTAATCLFSLESEHQYVVHRCEYSNEEDCDDVTERGSIVIKQLSEIQKELMLIDAKIKLANDPEMSLSPNLQLSTGETITYLVHAGYYDDAFSISTKFKLEVKSVFQSLATRCVHSSYTESNEVKNWLDKNQNSISLQHGHSCASDLAWLLLRDYLHQMNSNENYRKVLDVLLGFRANLPEWFIKDYKKINCPELIRTLICFDYLDLATRLSLDYITGVMGFKPEEFGIQHTLRDFKYSVWIPSNEIQQLMNILQEQSSTKHLKMHAELQSKLDEYVELLQRVEAR